MSSVPSVVQRVGESGLRLWDPATDAWLPTLQESRAAMLAKRQVAEAQAEQLREELDRLRRQPGK